VAAIFSVLLLWHLLSKESQISFTSSYWLQCCNLLSSSLSFAMGDLSCSELLFYLHTENSHNPVVDLTERFRFEALGYSQRSLMCTSAILARTEKSIARRKREEPISSLVCCQYKQ
jgi:hypothetical protein